MIDPRDATIAAYQADAATYAAATTVTPDSVVRDLDELAERAGAGARVLEVGSGPGHDARQLESRALVVRRTDVTPAFVELLRADGYAADVVDPLVDDLGGPWDAVWAHAVLIHLDRADLPVVLERLRAATRAGGTFYLSVQEGDGDAWLTRGHITSPRHFTFWREEPLRSALVSAGWEPVVVRRSESRSGQWLDVFARATASPGVR